MRDVVGLRAALHNDAQRLLGTRDGSVIVALSAARLQTKTIIVLIIFLSQAAAVRAATTDDDFRSFYFFAFDYLRDGEEKKVLLVDEAIVAWDSLLQCVNVRPFLVVLFFRSLSFVKVVIVSSMGGISQGFSFSLILSKNNVDLFSLIAS